MEFITQSTNTLNKNSVKLLRQTAKTDQEFVDAWISETDDIQSINLNGVDLKISPNGIFGEVEIPSESNIEEATSRLYASIFAALSHYPDYQLLRVWNYVPKILEASELQGFKNNYEAFNSGRFKAFQASYGKEFSDSMMPSASAVGSSSKILRIEFLAVKTNVTFLENKEQTAAKNYSNKYGQLPPLFSRGAIYKNLNQTLLISSGTASVVGEDSVHSDLYDQVNQSILNLRILGSQFNLKRYDIDYGFALEDAVLLRTYYKNKEDEVFLRKYLKKLVSPDCKLSFMQADICRDELLVEIEAVFVKKGEFEQNGKEKYFLNDAGKIRTESFELHIAEHCNLRCRDCCNISPLNPQKFMSVAEIEDICKFLKDSIQPDLFKIAGGEPTLHPEIDEIIRIIKQYEIAPQIRVVSNGLLVHRMSEYFWHEIDQLTISNYKSAPVKQRSLDLIKEKAKQYGFVTNIKYVEQFNEIFLKEPFTDQKEIQRIYDDCWMRHRCHIIRNGRFYKCTRAAYMDDYLCILKIDSKLGDTTYSEADGIDIKQPDFKEKALFYLNNKKPLASCRYCLGVSGSLRDNVQLSKKEIREMVE
ncbi:radical SAM protein [Marivirga tractuosa]|uniref:chorismate transformation enzyme, FkbO/Hyg5 family n=1 Tax=Marivirga tractuosa TaxID=1006 RepID=UPI0035D0719F